MNAIVVPLAFAAFFTLPVAVVAAYRYATGRGAGSVARIATFTRNALLTAAVILAMDRPGFYLLCGVVTAAFGWGLGRFGRWLERRLGDILRRQGRERSPALEDASPLPCTEG